MSMDGTVDAAPASSTKRPKQKVAIIFGYIGERYCGLQWNHLPGYPTIEEELLHALHRADMISRENYEQEKVQQKLNWERASRTDKGVHALRNVLSLNVMLPYAKHSTTEYDPQEARRLLMEHLPSDIIVYEIIPVTRSFNAYMMCGARTYEYYLPTFAFMSHAEYCQDFFPPAIAPSRPTLAEVGFPNATRSDNASNAHLLHKDGTEHETHIGEKRSRDVAPDPSIVSSLDKDDNEEPNTNAESAQKFHDSLFEKMLVFRTIPEETMRRVAQYRISPERLELARSMFRLYEGTQPFHNFTPGGRASDPSTSRYIISVSVGDPFLVNPATETDVLATLDEWTPARCFSPDTEGRQVQEEVSMSESDIAEERRRMREHMIQIYGDGGLEVVRIELQGQSFMFNQIRKMIGAVASMCAAGLPAEHLRKHLMSKTVRCGTPMVPANGLFLSYLDFQRYNYRLDRIQRQGNNGAGKDGVYVERVDAEVVAKFRRKIIAVVLRNEMVGDVTGRWMRSLRQVLRLAWKMELP